MFLLYYGLIVYSALTIKFSGVPKPYIQQHVHASIFFDDASTKALFGQIIYLHLNVRFMDKVLILSMHWLSKRRGFLHSHQRGRYAPDDTFNMMGII
jgi:hypothetical protein